MAPLANEAVTIDFQHSVLDSLEVNIQFFHSKNKYYYNIVQKEIFFFLLF